MNKNYWKFARKIEYGKHSLTIDEVFGLIAGNPVKNISPPTKEKVIAQYGFSSEVYDDLKRLACCALKVPKKYRPPGFELPKKKKKAKK